ncbi:MAG: hypothetical protein Q9O24_09160 [Gammaproteobacteria bacterium]|nr:hypothetical protein [Gammaproteobacteria bacterium]
MVLWQAFFPNRIFIMDSSNTNTRSAFLAYLMPLLGVIGLSVVLWFFMLFLNPDASTTEKVTNIAAGYIFALLLIFSWQSLIENAFMLILWNILLFTLMFATGDALSENMRLLVWSLLATIWYLPLFVLFLALPYRF